MKDILDKLKKKFEELKNSKSFDPIKKLGMMVTEREMLQNVENGFLQDPEELMAAKKLSKFKKEIELIKSKGVAGVKAAIELAKTMEEKIGDLEGKIEGKSKTEVDLTFKYPSGLKDILRGVNLLMEANLISQTDFSLSTTLKKELGDIAVEFSTQLKALAETRAKLKASAKFFDLSKGSLVKVLLHAELAVKASAEAMAKGELKLGKNLKLNAAVVGELELTGKASADGEVNIGITKVVLSGSAKAIAEGKATVKAIIGVFTIGDLGLETEIGVEALAEASAEATGTFTINPAEGDIAIGGTLGAKASVGAYGFAKPGIKWKEKMLMSVKGKGGVSAGAGGSATGMFAIKDGVLTIDVDCSAALEGGGEAGVQIAIDLKSTAVLIKEQATKKYTLWQSFTVEDGKTYSRLNDSLSVPIEKETYDELEVILAAKLKRKTKEITKLRHSMKNESKGKALIEKLLQESLKDLYKKKGFNLTEERVKVDEAVRAKIDQLATDVILLDNLTLRFKDLQIAEFSDWYQSDPKKPEDEESLL